MVRVGLDAQLLREQVAHAVGQVAVAGGVEAGVGLAAGQVRQQAGAEGVLPVRRDVGEGVVVVIEDEATIDQLIKRRRQVLINGRRGERLGADHNEVIPLEFSGVFVLLRRNLVIEVIVQCPVGDIVCQLVQRSEVQSRVDIVFVGRVGGLASLSLSFCVLLDGAFVKDFDVLLLALAAEVHVLQLQAGRRQKAEAFDALVRANVITPIVIIRRIEFRPANEQQQNQYNMADRQKPQYLQPTPPGQLGKCPGIDFLCKEGRDHWHQHGQQQQNVLDYRRTGLLPEGLQRLATHLHHRDGVERAENPQINQLAGIKHKGGNQQDSKDNPVNSPGKHRAQ